MSRALPRDFKKLLSGNPQVAAIVADMRFKTSKQDVETFLEFVHEQVSSLTPEDREELIEQAHKDAIAIKADQTYGTEKEKGRGSRR